ncbi:MAG TPA: phosphatidate cytidylyltransferase [Thiolinea sp.]|nr:phosphatidate cytidylyltransferase [Thiolinea sp.]
MFVLFDIPVHSLVVMLVVLALLLLATAVQFLLRRRHPERDYQELYLRIRSWWWMIGILFACLAFSKGSTIVLFGFISFLALKEFFSIVPTRLSDRRVIFWAYAAIPVQYYWVYSGWYGMFTVFIPVYVFLFLPMLMVLSGNTRGFIQAAGIMHWAVMLTVFCLSHMAYLIALPDLNPAAGSIGMVIFILFMTQLNDVSQYVFGKSLGRHKILPAVSPKKTREGFLGGLCTVALAAMILAPLLTPLGPLHGLFAGLLIGSAGFIGDVVISSVKRDLQIKDSGQLIPGHGGILDRFDSLIYTAPLFFHYLHYFAY